MYPSISLPLRQRRRPPPLRTRPAFESSHYSQLNLAKRFLETPLVHVGAGRNTNAVAFSNQLQALARAPETNLFLKAIGRLFLEKKIMLHEERERAEVERKDAERIAALCSRDHS